MKSKKNTIILILTAFMLYGNTLLNGWGMDDVFVLKDNLQVMKGISGIPEIFSTPYYSGPAASFGYRPLTKAMFALEYSVFGYNLPVHHLINVILYALCCLLVFRFLKRYFQERYGYFFVLTAALIWLTHPSHTEVVASLKNREEMLWMIFGFISVEHIEKYIDRSRIIFLFSSMVFFALSFLAKQSALSLLPAIPLLLWFRYGIELKPLLGPRNIRIAVVGLVLLIAGYFFYKLTYYLFSKDEIELNYFENPLRYNATLQENAGIALMTFIFYIKILLIPHPLVFYYGLYSVPELSLSSAPVMISAALLAVLIITMITGIRKKTTLSFGIGFFLFTLFMFSNIPEKVNGIIGERLLFVPSLGFAIILTSLLFLIFRINKEVSFKTFPVSAKIILVALLAFYAGKTIVRNTSWRDSLTLFKNDIRYVRNSVQANSMLAGEMMDRMLEKLQKGEPVTKFVSTTDSIIMLYRRAWVLYHDNYRAMNNLGDIYMTFKNKPDTALVFLTGAYKLEPDNFYVNYNIARGYEMKGKLKKALYFYQKAKAIKPEKKQTDESISRIERLLETGFIR